MRLEIVVGEELYAVDVSDSFITEAEGFFTQLDQALDRGWQMSREWVEHPSNLQRCQIAADRLLSALTQENHALAELAAAYILKRFPKTQRIDIDTTGDVSQTTFEPNLA